jgi:DNA-directed RNA polymerase subunit L
MRELTNDQIELALELALNRATIREIGERLGFTSDMEFYRYRQAHPLFDQELLTIRVASCEHLEDDLLNVCEGDINPKLARVKMESICRILAFRKPEKYGPKIDLNVNQRLDLAGVLAAANARLPESARDITPRQSDLDEIL